MIMMTTTWMTIINLGGEEEAVQQSPNPVPVKNAAH